MNRKITTAAALALVCLIFGFALGFAVRWGRNPSNLREAAAPDGGDSSNHSPPGGTPEGGVGDEPETPPHLTFETSNALEHILNLSSGVGYRPEGSAAEREAASYIASRFRSFGYEEVHRQDFTLDNGAASSNLYVVDPGSASDMAIVVGAHYDTAGGTGSPGANDNASGVGVVLELARVFRHNENIPTIIFVAFGAEEILPGYSKDHHHYGSRYMASHLPELGYNVVGMVSVDMVGVGNALTLNSTLQGPRTLIDMLSAYSRNSGLNPVFRQDQGWSDHEAFEKRGIPAVWIEYRDDPNYHTPADTYDKISPRSIAQAGCLLQGFLEALTLSDLQKLASSAAYRR